MVAGGAGIVVDRTYPVSEYPAALEHLRSGEQVGKIVLEHPIKQLGDFEIPIKLYPDVTAHVKLSVIEEKE